MKHHRVQMLIMALLIPACARTAVPPGSKPSIEDPPASLTATRADGATADGCGAELSSLQYKVQCADGAFAMLCLKTDTRQRRSACQRGGRYFWTHGYYCNGRLACYTRACR